jgi:Rieske Fe-S protein
MRVVPFDRRGVTSSNLEEVLPLAEVTPEAQGFSDSEGGDHTAFDAFTGLTGHLGCAAIFSTRLVEMSSEAIAFGQHGLQEEAQFFGAGHRFLQLADKRSAVHIS